MKMRIFFVATLLSIAGMANAAREQKPGTIEISKGDYFDCAPFPQNPIESTINRSTIVCQMSLSAPGPLPGGKFVGKIDGHQATWVKIITPDGNVVSLDGAEKTALVSVFNSRSQATLRVVAVSNIRIEH